MVVGCIYDKKLSCRRGTARRGMSVEIMSTAAWRYETQHDKVCSS